MSNSDYRLRPLKDGDITMTIFWILFIICGVALCVILVIKVFSWEKNDRMWPYLVPQNKVTVVTPGRGDILDCKGRILATSTLTYEVRLDCEVPVDTLWDRHLNGLANGLSTIMKGRTADAWLRILREGRLKNNRFLLIGKGFSQTQINQIRQLPIFNKGKYHGGYIEYRQQVRKYPYGTSAKRTLGYINNNNGSKTNSRGIEGNFDEYLHGMDGKQVMRRSDFGFIPVSDPRNAKAVDGYDVKTTIDVDIQTIAAQALQKTVESNELIEKACVIVLESKTGAVRAMVNLGRNEKGIIGEWDNYAVRTAEAPGSVFKGAVVMALLEDGYVTTLDHQIPTYGGKWKYNGNEYNDVKHVGPQRFPSGRIKLREAFEMSANNPFRQLICDERHYGNNPARFVKKIKSLGIVDTIDFDLKGSTPPFILDPSMKKRSLKGFWDGGTFPRMAIGYGMEISPLNIVTFYNIIANEGRMMKPYLVEAIQCDGTDIERFEPVVLREAVCTKATADTLKKVMSMVTSDKGGTAYWQLHGAVCPIAGKTGTAQRVFRKSNGTYGYNEGNIESQQGSFVGFFPVDNPKYTAIVVVWSLPSSKNFFGATYAAPPFREIADKIYCLNED